MSMIEKVAKALYEDQIKRYPGSKDAKEKFYDNKIYHIAAKIAIKTIREPTKEMIEKGLIPTSTWQDIKGSALTVNRAKMKLRYQAMIDAALKEI